MKKTVNNILCLLLVLVMGISLVSCGVESNMAENNDPWKEAEKTAETFLREMAVLDFGDAKVYLEDAFFEKKAADKVKNVLDDEKDKEYKEALSELVSVEINKTEKDEEKSIATVEATVRVPKKSDVEALLKLNKAKDDIENLKNLYNENKEIENIEMLETEISKLDWAGLEGLMSKSKEEIKSVIKAWIEKNEYEKTYNEKVKALKDGVEGKTVTLVLKRVDGDWKIAANSDLKPLLLQSGSSVSDTEKGNSENPENNTDKSEGNSEKTEGNIVKPLKEEDKKEDEKAPQKGNSDDKKGD